MITIGLNSTEVKVEKEKKTTTKKQTKKVEEVVDGTEEKIEKETSTVTEE